MKKKTQHFPKSESGKCLRQQKGAHQVAIFFAQKFYTQKFLLLKSLMV